MIRKNPLSEKDLYKAYDAIQFYLSRRYQNFSYEELKAIQKVLCLIEEEYEDQEGKPVTRARHEGSGRKRTISDETNQKIIDLRNEGKTLRAIAKECNVSVSHVQKTVLPEIYGHEKHPKLDKDSFFWEAVEQAHREGKF